MKTSQKRLLLFFLLLFVLSLFVAKYQEKIHPRLLLGKIAWKLDPYHELRTILFGDPQKDQIKIVLVNREDRVTFPAIEKDIQYFREKWIQFPGNFTQ